MAPQNKAPLLVIISGPTAVGKTALSVEIAKSYQAPIISADSRQIYQEMPIGTAQPAQETLETVPHHFISSHSIHDAFTAGDFERESLAILEEHYKNHNIAFVVGGTLFYIRALTEGLDIFPSISDRVQQEVLSDLKTQGLDPLQKELEATDPQSFKEMDIQNSRRVCRALMVIRETGQPFSSFKTHAAATRPFTPLFIQLTRPRQEIYDRINQRVDAMIAHGLENEARTLYPYRHLKACDTVGYKEWFHYFNGDWTREKAIEKIKQHTRNYAKRQLTWFRKEKEKWNVFSPDAVEEIQAFIKVKGFQG